MTLEEMLKLEAPEGAMFFTLEPAVWLKYEGLHLFGISMHAGTNDRYWQRVETKHPMRSLYRDTELIALKETLHERKAAQG